MMFKALFGLFCAVIVNVQIAFADETDINELIITYGDNDIAPFVVVESGELRSGIIKDIGEALAEVLGLQPVFLNIPRKRMPDFVATGKAHVRIGFNPNWVDNPDQFYWSEVLFEDSDIVVIRKNSAGEIGHLSHLYNRRIGTILGYSYADLEPYFAGELILRDDSQSITANLDRLSRERIDAVVTSKRSYEYYQLKHQANDEYAVLMQLPKRNPLSAMFSKVLPVSSDELHQACVHLRDSGKIATILERYQLSLPRN